MPGDYNEGDTYTIEEQVAFASYMTQSLTDAGIPFAVNADQHFYDREQRKWLEDMQPVFAAIYGQQILPSQDLPEDTGYRSAVPYVYRCQLLSGTSAATYFPLRSSCLGSR